jgi:hypothetical protein
VSPSRFHNIGVSLRFWYYVPPKCIGLNTVATA